MSEAHVVPTNELPVLLQLDMRAIEIADIKKSKIRGVESNGMICALFELGLEEKTEENYNKGITELESDAPVGENAFTYLDMGDTTY